ncbi:uncharacterized, partial [Tachysurus ichikawai]
AILCPCTLVSSEMQCPPNTSTIYSTDLNPDPVQTMPRFPFRQSKQTEP